MRRVLTVTTRFKDWFHESCLHLRERPTSRAPSPEPHTEPNGATAEGAENEHAIDDAQSEASFSGLPPPLIAGSSYDALVCGACVTKIDTLRRYAGTPGVLMVVRDTPADAWRVIGHSEDSNDPVDIGARPAEEETAVAGEKRLRVASPERDQQTKRPRPSSPPPVKLENDSANGDVPLQSPCLAPEPNAKAQSVLSAMQAGASDTESLGAGDIFLTEGWRDRWCRCTSVCLLRAFATLTLILLTHSVFRLWRHIRSFSRKKKHTSLQKTQIQVCATLVITLLMTDLNFLRRSVARGARPPGAAAPPARARHQQHTRFQRDAVSLPDMDTSYCEADARRSNLAETS